MHLFRLTPSPLSGLVSGLAHPVFGPDHLLFLLALGLVGLQKRLSWVLGLLATGLAGSCLGLALPGIPLAEPLVALSLVVVGLVLSLVLVRHTVQPDDAAWSPWAVAALAALGLLVAAPLGWFAQSLPLAAMWPLLGLPGAVSLALVLGIVLELVALLAARRQLLTPRPVRSAVEEANVPVEADLMKLFGEVDRELFRRWAEGIPNRRYTRQPPVVDPAAEEGSFSAVVLEESQPLVPPPMAVPGEPVGSTRWLWVLGVAGLLLTHAVHNGCVRRARSSGGGHGGGADGWARLEGSWPHPSTAMAHRIGRVGG
jgi:hypothetical protein